MEQSPEFLESRACPCVRRKAVFVTVLDFQAQRHIIIIRTIPLPFWLKAQVKGAVSMFGLYFSCLTRGHLVNPLGQECQRVKMVGVPVRCFSVGGYPEQDVKRLPWTFVLPCLYGWN